MKCSESGLKSRMTNMSPNAQNEILQIMALKVLRGIACDLAESGYHSVMTDASNIEQLVVCICWVDTIECEEYISLVSVPQTNADTVVVCIKDVL